MNRLKKKCEKAFDVFWNDCLEKSRKELESEGYIEIEEGVFAYGLEDRKDLKNSKIYLIDCASQEMEDTINGAEVIAGYYINYHGKDSLKDWINNTNGYPMTEQDKEVQRILEKIYGRKEVFKCYLLTK